jgi:branched-chain amino acid aminotransferase
LAHENDPDTVIWLDGAYVPMSDFAMPFLTHAVHYGGFVFEGIRVYGGKIFKLRPHIDRLFAGARVMGFDLPYDRDDIEEACRLVVTKNGFTDCYLRPAAWRGHGVGLSATGIDAHAAVVPWIWPTYFTLEQRMKGVRLTHTKWRRPAPDTATTEAKVSGLYQICSLAKKDAETAGYDDALMLDYRGYVAEATGSNIFFVFVGELHTPIPDCFLNGITRQTVIGLAEEMGMRVVERHILPEEIAGASEVFLTGTAVEVTPISQIGDARFKPGTVCRELIERFAALIREPS